MITVVSGLPRSGTSLMMQILEAGGMEILTDDIRKADQSNPRGYYEYEKVKGLLKDNSWFAEAEGKAVKVIAQLISYLPLNFQYNVIFMERNMDEILLSQDKMIDMLGGKKAVVDKSVLKTTFRNQVSKVKEYLAGRENFNEVFVNYNELVKEENQIIHSMNSNLNLRLDIDKSLEVIDYSLYRNKL